MRGLLFIGNPAVFFLVLNAWFNDERLSAHVLICSSDAAGTHRLIVAGIGQLIFVSLRVSFQMRRINTFRFSLHGCQAAVDITTQNATV